MANVLYMHPETRMKVTKASRNCITFFVVFSYVYKVYLLYKLEKIKSLILLE